VLGERLLSVRFAGDVMVKGSEFELCKPDCTLMEALPALAIRFAGTVAINWLALTNAVAKATEFQYTLRPEKKPLPLTIRANEPLPATALLGRSVLIVRLETTGVMVKVSDAGCGWVVMLTAAVPAESNNDAGTMALSCCGEMNVV
jgi:hypothetical protein